MAFPRRLTCWERITATTGPKKPLWRPFGRNIMKRLGRNQLSCRLMRAVRHLFAAPNPSMPLVQLYFHRERATSSRQTSAASNWPLHVGRITRNHGMGKMAKWTLLNGVHTFQPIGNKAKLDFQVRQQSISLLVNKRSVATQSCSTVRQICMYVRICVPQAICL